MIVNQHQKINQIATKYLSNPWFALQPSYSIIDLVARQLRGALVLILESKVLPISRFQKSNRSNTKSGEAL